MGKSGGWASPRRPFASPETGNSSSRRSVSIAPTLVGTRDRLLPARGTTHPKRGIVTERPRLRREFGSVASRARPRGRIAVKLFVPRLAGFPIC